MGDEMNDKQIFAIMTGLTYLDAEDMRTLLYEIATFDTKGTLEGNITFALFARKIINDKILSVMREKTK
jgi:hypothetical protein